MTISMEKKCILFLRPCCCILFYFNLFFGGESMEIRMAITSLLFVTEQLVSACSPGGKKAFMFL